MAGLGVVGVFGGTFDPPHLGHVILASEGWSRLGLEKVLWVLTPFPPHKPDAPLSPLEFRIEMTKAAVSQNMNFEFSSADIDRPPPHYSLGTMEYLIKENPNAKLAYLMGSDSLNDLPSWHKASVFMDHCYQIGVLQRPGFEIDLSQLETRLPGISSKIKHFTGPTIDITARDIRARVKRGAPYNFLVPHGVAEIILKNNLYQ